MFCHTEKTLSGIQHSEAVLMSGKPDISNGSLLILLRAAQTSPPILPHPKYFMHTSFTELSTLHSNCLTIYRFSPDHIPSSVGTVSYSSFHSYYLAYIPRWNIVCIHNFLI